MSDATKAQLAAAKASATAAARVAQAKDSRMGMVLAAACVVGVVLLVRRK